MTNKILDGEAVNKILRIGDQFHVLGQAVMVRLSQEYDGTKILEPGTTVVLTEVMVSLAAEDPKGSWTSIIADPTAQVDRWGRVRFGVGAATGNFWRYKDPAWEFQRRAALEVVWGITNPSDRAQALSEVQNRFAFGQGREAWTDE